jgi:hypothetical protein
VICSSKISPDLYLEDGEEKLFGYSGYMNFIPLIPDSKVAVIRDKEGFFAFIKRDDATDELISRAEETMGYKLPESYKELLRFRNGGSVNGDLEECWLTEIDEFFTGEGGISYEERPIKPTQEEKKSFFGKLFKR